MALGAEPVEGPAHVQFLFRGHVKEGQIDGGAACVAAFFHDIFLLEQDALIEIGIEIGLHLRIRYIGRPADEMVDALLRTVGVVNLEAVTLAHDVVAHGLEGCGGFLCQQGRRRKIAVDAAADKVVGAVVADLEDCVRDYVSDGDKAAAVFGGGGNGRVVVAPAGGKTGEKGDAGEEDPKSLHGNVFSLANIIILAEIACRSRPVEINY